MAGKDQTPTAPSNDAARDNGSRAEDNLTTGHNPAGPGDDDTAGHALRPPAGADDPEGYHWA